MAIKRKVDRSKKSNIKCEHCKHWAGKSADINKVCNVTGNVRNYYNRCKNFEWKDDEE